MDQLVKPVTWLFGVVFIAIGILGFINNPILGLFSVNAVHNIVHLLSGAVALGAASSGYKNSRLYLIIFGLVYALVTVLGFVTPDLLGSLLNANLADNYLHLVIAAVTLLIGFLSAKNPVHATA
ncbi:MAG: hypothetical protein JWM56_250 [Candidatus Peribacteria bacterium]|nr:hypothetical protein [Candidatus Peribacteria bacterium]